MIFIYDELPDKTLFDFNITCLAKNDPLTENLKIFDLDKTALLNGIPDRKILLAYKKENTSNLNIISHFADNNLFGLLPRISAFFSESLTDASGWSGRKWVADKGNLHLSLLIKPDIPLNSKYLNYLRIIIFNSITQTLDGLISPVHLKLPSDILFNRKKIGGVIEKCYCGSEIKAAVFGIGLNINVLPSVRDLSDFVAGVDSVSNITSKTYKLSSILFSIVSLTAEKLNCLESDICMLREDFEYFNSHLYNLNRHIKLYKDQKQPLLLREGILCGMNEEGGLLFHDSPPGEYLSPVSFRIPV